MAKLSLFEQLCTEEKLFEAWKCVKTKNAAGGIDGISVTQFNKDSASQIHSLACDLRERKWIPSPYLQVSDG